MSSQVCVTPKATPDGPRSCCTSLLLLRAKPRRSVPPKHKNRWLLSLFSRLSRAVKGDESLNIGDS